MKKLLYKSNRCFALKGFISLTLFCLLISSCEKLIEVDPPIQNVVKEDVYSNTVTASAVLIGLYHEMAQGAFLSFSTGSNSLSVNLGLYADELGSVIDFTNPFYTNNLLEDNDYYWTELYTAIFRANSAIEGLSGSSSLIPEVKDRLIGEAKFLRGLYYFYLVNLFGDVPLLTTSDYTINGTAPRTSTATVFEQIIKDLKEAEELLGNNYVGSDILVNSNERARPNKSAATALLARVYLYNSQWQDAETEAGKLIANTDTYGLTSLDSVFLKNSREAIWQLQPVITYTNTPDAFYFIPALNAPQVSVYLNEPLREKFEVGDNRKTNWMQEFNSSGLYYPFKYKIAGYNGSFEEYIMVFRLAEQYLIRAEARAHLDNLDGAKADMYEIRKRAGLVDPITLNTQEEILSAVADERQKELFTEWGHRWFDLKRTGKADEVLSALKPSTWATTKQLFPIPKNEILKNPSLTGHQNPGY